VLDPLLPLTVPLVIQLKSVGSDAFTVRAAVEPMAVEVTVRVPLGALAVNPGEEHAPIDEARFPATVVALVLLI